MESQPTASHGVGHGAFGLLVAAGIVLSVVWPRFAAGEEYQGLEKPFRLKTEDGALIDSGDAWGHSGPCVEDVDGDGVRDLLVGDFSGLFRLYRNIGSDQQPRYAAYKHLQAGGEDAKVWVY